MKIMTERQMAIAEEDLKMRGSGEIFGTRQSVFRISSGDIMRLPLSWKKLEGS